jgi:hypothetical protein
VIVEPTGITESFIVSFIVALSRSLPAGCLTEAVYSARCMALVSVVRRPATSSRATTWSVILGVGWWTQLVS